MKLRVIIADDMPLAREELRYLLHNEPDIEIVRECVDGRETVAAVRETKPDLLFLDVQMPDLDGFGVLYELAPDEMPTTIFVTAYDQYALRAFDVHAADYLMKPVDAHRFHETLARVRRQMAARSGENSAGSFSDLLREIAERRLAYQRLAVPHGDRILFIPTETVISLEARENYVLVHTTGGRHLLRDTMAHIMRRLDPERFLRVHRSWIVNHTHVRELIPGPQRTYVLVLDDGQKVKVSRSYRERVEGLVGRKT
ncbi:MAG: LytR/AlgR family response regulator transcription factor [Acidobacteriota bacterium]